MTKIQGFGLGLRVEHYAAFEAGVEPALRTVAGDHFRELHGAGRQAAVAFGSHSRRLPAGDARRVDVDRLHGAAGQRLPAGLEGTGGPAAAGWVSDHLCWTGVDHRNLHDLLPMPYSRSA